jgi:hypothetical protein
LTRARATPPRRALWCRAVLTGDRLRAETEAAPVQRGHMREAASGHQLAAAAAQPRRSRPARHSAGPSARALTVCPGPRATPAAAARAVCLAAAAARPRDDAARRGDQRHGAAPLRPARVPGLGVVRASCLRAAPALFGAARRHACASHLGLRASDVVSRSGSGGCALSLRATASLRATLFTRARFYFTTTRPEWSS